MASNTRTERSSCRLVLAAAAAAVLLLATCVSATDYYGYQLDGGVSQVEATPQFKLLFKRQAPAAELAKDKGKQALLLKESKMQTETEAENSSNSKTGIAAPIEDAAAPLNTTEAISTTGAPSTTTTTVTVAPEVDETTPFPETVQDFDGTNVTVANRTYDTHRYYNSTTYSDGEQFYVDLEHEDMATEVITHQMLSQAHRRAAVIVLSFDFPFYGHMVRNITIATGGFLFTGDYSHSWLAATQYMAPLMANFDTSKYNESTVKYLDTGDSLTVQWENVPLQDHPSAGNFTFQATLKINGDIIFAYKNIPAPVTSIGDKAHPVKIGLSDAYIIDRTFFFQRRKTIYEYHKVELKRDDIRNGTAIYFTALTTCVSLKSCDSCIKDANAIGFDCLWCPTVDRCSDGMDRHRQDWLIKGCDKFFVDDAANCSAAAATTDAPSSLPTTTSPAFKPTLSPTLAPEMTDEPTPSRVQNATAPPTTTSTSSTSTTEATVVSSPVDAHLFEATAEQQHSNVSSVLGVLFLVAMIFGSAGWLFYAYRNPHTPSGQCFIRYRPSQWRWRSGEAHYTAAAIHM